jgi:hypothetical protein
MLQKNDKQVVLFLVTLPGGLLRAQAFGAVSLNGGRPTRRRFGDRRVYERTNVWPMNVGTSDVFP